MQLTKLLSKLLNRISLIGKWRHLYHIKKAKQVLKKLKEINRQPNSDGRIISYLRKISPYVFEELFLTAIENMNIRVIRNKKYSGDDGIDGIFSLSQGKVIVQCKRYSKHINNKDVTQLSNKVKEGKFFLGVFVHTGKTGEKSKETAKNEKNVIFISGSILVKIILGQLNIKDYIQSKI